MARLGALGIVTGVSSLWETAPIGGVPQDDYLNAVVGLDTVIGPRPLLQAFLAIEADAGRERRERWGPRTLDLDLLLYGDAVIAAEGLQIPHPRMGERRFVLEPLSEVWPDAIVPGLGSVTRLLDSVRAQTVERIEADWLAG